MEPKIPQYQYYQRTPGHNPLLVNRFVENTGADAAADKQAAMTVFNFNLRARPGPGAPLAFDTVSASGGTFWRSSWHIAMPPKSASLSAWGFYEGIRPIAWNPNERETAYWIVRCPKKLINGHSDIWNESAMQMYAAFIR